MKEPRSESLLAARLARAYPSLSAYSSATLAEELCRIERAQRRHAERCCSGEDGGYTKPGCDAQGRDYVFKPGRAMASPLMVHDPDAEERAGNRIKRRIGRWADRFADVTPIATIWQNSKRGFASAMLHSVTLQHDPRGRVLLLRLPGEAEAVGV